MNVKQLRLFHNLHNEGKKILEQRRMITLHLDPIVLFSVINILVLVLTFSLVIEKGRKIGGIGWVKRI